MRVALLGGTGRIGGQVLTSMLAAGHDVTMLAREPAGLAGRSADTGSLTIVRGSAADAAAVQATVDGADAVLSALGPRGAKTPGLLGTAARNVTAAMAKTGARRLICVSAAGPFIAGDQDMNLLVKIILPRVLAKPFADVRDMEAAIGGTDLDWTLVRASRLVDAPPAGRYRVRPEYAPAGGGKISRADVAHFIAAALAEGSWIRGRPALAY
jgi:putative NADH-flavin reductase